MKLLLILLLLFSCGKNEHIIPVNKTIDLIIPNPTWVLYSPTGIVSKQNNDVGDALLFAGLLCLSGEAAQCQAVRASQGVDGRMWRAPELIGGDNKNSFSRDMLLGYLSYLIKTEDKKSASAFQVYLKNNNYKLCDNAEDNRCMLTPGSYGLMKLVWQYIGLDASWLMLLGNIGDESTIIAESMVATDYQAHLVGVKIFLYQKMGKYTSKLHQALDNISMQDKENPFFRYLVGEYERASEQYNKYIPTEEPAEKIQWSIERNFKDYKKETSMIAEWIFLYNLLK